MALVFPRFGRLRKNRALAALATVAFVLLLPVLVPFALVSDFVGRRRMRSVILASKCPACGAQLNLDALALGEARWKEVAREIWASHSPDTRLRIVRSIHAVCCACGVELTYREASHDLAVRVR